MSHIDEPRLRLIYEIMKEKSRSAQAFVQYMTTNREYGPEDTLHMREAHFIMTVGPGEGKTMSEVAKGLSVTHGAVSQTAGRLEKKGYVLRKRDTNNQRQIVAILTPKGEKFYQQHLQYDRARFAAMDADYLSRFTDEELQVIRDYEAVSCLIFTKRKDYK